MRTERPARSGWCLRPASRLLRSPGSWGVNEGTLGNWVNLWRRDNPEPVPELNPVERARVKEMEDELRRLRMENEFLKKVVMAPVAPPGGMRIERLAETLTWRPGRGEDGRVRPA